MPPVLKFPTCPRAPGAGAQPKRAGPGVRSRAPAADERFEPAVRVWSGAHNAARTHMRMTQRVVAGETWFE